MEQQIDRLIADLDRLGDKAVDVVERSPLPNRERRHEVGAVRFGIDSIARALLRAKESYAGSEVPFMVRLESLLSRLTEGILPP